MIFETWFAWYPVRTNNGWRWLTCVMRQQTMTAQRVGAWHYRIQYGWRYLT